jgi:hypothetical protein
MTIRIPSSPTLLRVSAVFTIIGLALMAWSMLVPTVWPIMIAMSAGQGFGTIAFGLYLFCIVRDLRGGKGDAA